MDTAPGFIDLEQASFLMMSLIFEEKTQENKQSHQWNVWMQGPSDHL